MFKKVSDSAGPQGSSSTFLTVFWRIWGMLWKISNKSNCSCLEFMLHYSIDQSVTIVRHQCQGREFKGSLSVILFTGLGYCTLVVISLVTIYYQVIVAWTIFYIFASFTSELGWGSCGHDFNTDSESQTFFILDLSSSAQLMLKPAMRCDAEPNQSSSFLYSTFLKINFSIRSLSFSVLQKISSSYFWMHFLYFQLSYTCAVITN